MDKSGILVVLRQENRQSVLNPTHSHLYFFMVSNERRNNAP